MASEISSEVQFPENESINLPPNHSREITVDRIRYLYETHLCNRTSTETDAEGSHTEVSQFFGTRPNSWMRSVAIKHNSGDQLLRSMFTVVAELVQNEFDGKDSEKDEVISEGLKRPGARMKYLYEDHWLKAETFSSCSGYELDHSILQLQKWQLVNNMQNFFGKD